MRKYFSAVIILLLVCNAGVYAQSKIVFRNGMHRAVIKPGKIIGVTVKGETYKYDNWKSVCKGCYVERCMDSLYDRDLYVDSIYFYDRDCADTICYNNMWTLDSVREDYIVVRRLSDDSTDFRLDTISSGKSSTYIKSMTKKHADFFWVETIMPPDSNYNNVRYVYAVPTDYYRKRISMDSVQSFTFSEMNNCSTFDLGSVLLAGIAIVAAPIAASDGPGFSWPAFLVGEALGGYMIGSMYKNIQDLRVKRYEVSEWKVKVK